jgi:hypothetical protein
MTATLARATAALQAGLLLSSLTVVSLAGLWWWRRRRAPGSGAGSE